MKKVLGLIICSTLLLTACSEEKDANITYNSYDSNFTITATSGWSIPTQGTLNDEADLELVDNNNNKYFVALMEAKEDFDWSYEEYATNMLESNAESYGITIDEIQTITIDEHECQYIEFKTTTDNTSLNFYTQVYIVETDNYYGQLMTWTIYSQSDEYRDEFIEMVKTFKEVN